MRSLDGNGLLQEELHAGNEFLQLALANPPHMGKGWNWGWRAREENLALQKSRDFAKLIQLQTQAAIADISGLTAEGGWLRIRERRRPQFLSQYCP